MPARSGRRACVCCVGLRVADERWHFSGYSRSQEAPKARFTRFHRLDALARALPLSPVRQQLLVKDVKIFLRDVSQWSQLLLLLALVLHLSLQLPRARSRPIPYMSGFVKNVYAFVNLGMAGFVLATVAVRFVFPTVSAEGAAFWLIRKSPMSMHDFLWSKFWTGLVPVLMLTETLTIAANELLGVDPFLKIVSAVAIVFLSFALVGLATGLGARYPRFTADNPSQVAGSYGGVAFMILAVLLIIVMIVLLGWPSTTYLFYRMRRRPIPTARLVMMADCFAAAVAISSRRGCMGMRSGVRALDAMSNSGECQCGPRPPPRERDQSPASSLTMTLTGMPATNSAIGALARNACMNRPFCSAGRIFGAMPPPINTPAVATPRSPRFPASAP